MTPCAHAQPGRVGGPLPEHLDGVADRRQRVAQLVGEHRQELVLLPVGLLDLVVEPGVLQGAWRPGRRRSRPRPTVGRAERRGRTRAATAPGRPSVRPRARSGSDEGAGLRSVAGDVRRARPASTAARSPAGQRVGGDSRPAARRPRLRRARGPGRSAARSPSVRRDRARPRQSARSGSGKPDHVAGGDVRVERPPSTAPASARNASRRLASSAASRLRPLLGQRDPLLRLPPHLLRHPVQVDEHPDLRPQDRRDDRRGDVIHRALGVPLGDADLVGERGQEDDRRVGRPLPPADERGRLQPVHPRHLDVEQDDREVVAQDAAQRLLARPGGDEVLAQLVEDGPVDQKLLRQVVHDQDVRRLVQVIRQSSVVEWSSVSGIGHGASSLGSRDSSHSATRDH